MRTYRRDSACVYASVTIILIKTNTIFYNITF